LSAACYRVTEDGLVVRVRLTPRAGRERVDGVVDGDGEAAYLAVRVAAPPVENAANEALIAFLAKRWGIARSRLAIEAGERARVKTLTVRGAGEELAAALADLGGLS
jgi:uncharacterized protein (TIGR00251 family)